MDNEKRTCFIITPMGNKTDPIRRHVEGIIDSQNTLPKKHFVSGAYVWCIIVYTVTFA